MAEIKERTLKILESLSQMAEPAKPSQIGEPIGEKPIDVGRHLGELLKAGYAEKTNEAENLWAVTEGGAEYLATIEESTVSQSRVTGPVPAPPTVPSQADLFRGICERLGVGTKKGDIRLDAIIYYVQRTADLDNLSSVWNALTEMGVANDVKKRLIKLYAQNLPSKEIPEELKEKLEGGLEPDKVKADTEGIPPKPKRFSVVGGEIIGDPEGDYSFKEALQYVAQQKGVPSAQADPLAAMVEAMKLGPEMATATLTTMIPLITKEPLKPDNTVSQTLQALKEAGVLGKQEGSTTQIEMLDKLNQLGMLKKPGEGAEGSQTIMALQTEVKELRESLQKQEMDAVKNAVVSISNQLSEMRKDMANQGKLEGRYAILEKTIGAIDSQLTGIRSDAKPLLAGLGGVGGKEPAQKSPEEKAKLARGLKQAVALEEEAHKLEDELLFGGKPQG